LIKGGNALSRSIEEPELKSMIHTLIWLDCQELTANVHEDNEWKKEIEELQQGNNDKAYTGFTYKQGLAKC